MIAATPWPPKLWLNSLQPTMPLSAVILRKSKARQIPSARSASMRSIFMGLLLKFLLACCDSAFAEVLGSLVVHVAGILLEIPHQFAVSSEHAKLVDASVRPKIGRASCRERV